MRVSRWAALAFVLFACHAPAPAARPVLSAPAPPAFDAERSAAVTLGKSGHIERAVAKLLEVDRIRPATRPQSYAAEVDWLADLGQCDRAGELGGEIAMKGDDEAKRAAAFANAECARTAHPPTDEALAAMRTPFHAAARAEAADPARAAALYAEAWKTAPTLAALLGMARAAKAKGDAALAERSLERALAFAERQEGANARVAVTPGASDGTLVVQHVGAASAILLVGQVVARLDTSNGTLRVLASLPSGVQMADASEKWVVLGMGRDAHPRLMRVGIDDAQTAAPLDLSDRATFSIAPDDTMIAALEGENAYVLDPETGKVLAKRDLGSDEALLSGVTSHRDVVVTLHGRVCVLSPPDWYDCRQSDDLTSPLVRSTNVAGHYLAFMPGPNTIRVYDVQAKRVVRDLTGHFASVSSLELSGDGKTLISTSLSRAVAWNLATGKRTEIVHTMYQPTWSPDGKRLFDGLLDDAVVVRDGTRIPGVPMMAAASFPPAAQKRALEVGATGALWAGGNHVVQRVDWRAGAIATVPIEGRVESLAVSSDEKHFAAGVSLDFGGLAIEVFDARGSMLAKLPTDSLADGVEFQGRQVVFSSENERRSYDLDTKKVTRGVHGTPDAVVSLPSTWIFDNAGTLVSIFDGPGKQRGTLDLGMNAYVLTLDGKSRVFGDEASAGCSVGSVWLPLDACRDRLLSNVSL